MPEDGPSFLTAPPVAPPEPEERGRIVLPPAPPPYREPGKIAPPRAQKPTGPIVSRPEPEAEEPPVRVRSAPESEAGIPVGDSEGEHFTIEHGKYGAWFYVVLAFIMEGALLGALPYWLLAHFSESLALGGAGLIGGAGAFWVFHDRWRCIEAFSSKFCSGVMNLSLLYVPFVALTYATIRGIGKLRRR